jgi:hypothetical protein
MALALDGSFSGTTTSGTFSCASGDVVMCFIFTDNVPTSVADNSGNSTGWIKRTSSVMGAFNISLWYTTTTAAWSGVTITPTVASGNIYANQGCGISGANTATPFDTNGSIPLVVTNAAAGTYSTNATNTFIFAGGSSLGSFGADATDGFTGLFPYTNFTLTQYQILSTPASGANYSSGNASSSSILDAVVAAGGGGAATISLGILGLATAEW